MNATTAATLAIAVTAVLGSIGSVLLLALRVGKLIGATEQRLANGEGDRAKLWEAIRDLMSWRNRHMEQRHRWVK